jgi:predicted amidohydrolase
MIVDPWGIVLAVAPDSETVIVADLDLEVLRDVRRRLPALEHRRPADVYAPGTTAPRLSRRRESAWKRGAISQ